jgi:CRP/FNR family transcriptional regulator, cyclic AMP receptor protein
VSGPREFLALLDDDERRALDEIGTTRRAARGEAVLSQGQVADKIVLLLQGRIKVVTSTFSGDETLLTVRGPGALVGEQALLDGSPRSATAVAVEPVEYLVVAASAFKAYLERRPRVAFELLALLSIRLRDSDHRVAQFAAADTLGRVSARLVELCEEHGEPGEDGAVTISLPLTQEELASWTGSSLESTAKALRTMRDLGWIATGRRAITVHDLDALRDRSA